MRNKKIGVERKIYVSPNDTGETNTRSETQTRSHLKDILPQIWVLAALKTDFPEAQD